VESNVAPSPTHDDLSPHYGERRVAGEEGVTAPCLHTWVHLPGDEVGLIARRQYAALRIEARGVRRGRGRPSGGPPGECR
jgi:hypothetical protein